MKKFCIDTSAITNPLYSTPEDVYPTLWLRVAEAIESGIFAVTTEIYEELNGSVSGRIGECIDANRTNLVMEIAAGNWSDVEYVEQVTRMQSQYRRFISEYSEGNPAKTVCMNDISIIALSKTLGVPVVSMEASTTTSERHKRIPDICRLDGIEHLDFNQLLRRIGIAI